MRNLLIISTITFGAVMNVTAQVKTTDSMFIQKSHPINFVVDRIDISDKDREWITNNLIPELKALGNRGIILGGH